MTSIDYAAREITAKVVYYGPGLCGKATNLEWIYSKTNPGARGRLPSLAAEHDPTLQFYFLPLELGTVRGFKTRFHLYSVPNLIFHAPQRRLIMEGVDRAVFVCDSQEERLEANLASWHEFESFIAQLRHGSASLPLVFQYNKRDLLNAMAIETINSRLNAIGAPIVEAVAVRGEGVFESLKAVASLVLQQLTAKSADAVACVGSAEFARLPPPDANVSQRP